MDSATLAAAALAAITPYLADLGKDVAEEGVKATGKAVFGWIKGKLTSAGGKEAVAKLEKAPQARGAQLALEGQLLSLLEENPDALASLRKLMADAKGGGMSAQVSGTGNIVGQADRGGNVTINRS